MHVDRRGQFQVKWTRENLQGHLKVNIQIRYQRKKVASSSDVSLKYMSFS